MSKKLTPWFPRWTYPKRIGFYISSVYPGVRFYRFWDGHSWFYGGKTLKEAVLRQRIDPERWPIHTPLTWRGLAEKP